MKNLFGEEITTVRLLDRKILSEKIRELLDSSTLESFSRLLTNEFECVVDFARLCNGEKTGANISLLFNPHRLDVAAKERYAIYSSFQYEGSDFAYGLARAVIAKSEEGARALLDQALRWGCNSRQYISDFPPFHAVQIYKRAKASSPRILDPCAGWGGRMIAAAVVGGQYTAFEPAKRTYEGLLRLGEWLKGFHTGFRFQVFNIPYEDAKPCHFKNGPFDIAFTSPPYYDTEHYSDEPTQSCNRYPTFEAWLKGFFRPLIRKTMENLRPKAFFVINLCDRRYPLSLELKKSWKRVSEFNMLMGSGTGLGREVAKRETLFRLDK